MRPKEVEICVFYLWLCISIWRFLDINLDVCGTILGHSKPVVRCKTPWWHFLLPCHKWSGVCACYPNVETLYPMLLTRKDDWSFGLQLPQQPGLMPNHLLWQAAKQAVLALLQYFLAATLPFASFYPYPTQKPILHLHFGQFCAVSCPVKSGLQLVSLPLALTDNYTVLMGWKPWYKGCRVCTLPVASLRSLTKV